MKALLINLILIVSLSGIAAQERFEYDLSGIKKIKIKVSGNLRVVGHGSDKLFINSLDHDDHDHHGHHNLNHHSEDCEHNDENKEEYEEKRKGLKAIYSGGIDNTGFGVRMEKDGNVLTIKSLKNHYSGGDYEISIPSSMEVSIDNGAFGDIYVEKIDADIEIVSNVGDIAIIGVTGPITANSSIGDITIEFTKVNQSAPITVRAQTGDVDVRVPANSKLDLVLNSSMGDVYTDLDVVIEHDNDSSKSMFGQRIKCKLNNGGVKMSLSSSIGDVLLRKK